MFTIRIVSRPDFLLHARAVVANFAQGHRQQQLIAVAAHAQKLGFQVYDGQTNAAFDEFVFREADVQQKVFLHFMRQVKTEGGKRCRPDRNGGNAPFLNGEFHGLCSLWRRSLPAFARGRGFLNSICCVYLNGARWT